MSAKLIVALDVETFQKARRLVDRLYPKVRFFKVGSQLFTACGPEIVSYVVRKGAKVFLDLKFHDIPNTVANAVRAASRPGVFMLTLHASGGREMLEMASRIKGRKPLLVAVTVLTSQKSSGVRQRVFALARLAAASGLNGVVASARECREIKKKLGRKFIVVTPGIRPQGAVRADQKRVMTPQDAVNAGSDFLVVGRPVVEAKDPARAAEAILKEMRGQEIL